MGPGDNNDSLFTVTQRLIAEAYERVEAKYKQCEHGVLVSQNCFECVVHKTAARELGVALV